MARESNPGLKILWIWTIGTAAILVTNVVRTRLRDVQQAIDNEQQQQSSLSDSFQVDPLPESDEGFVKEVKTNVLELELRRALSPFEEREITFMYFNIVF